jgi:hypothetical protein
MTSYIATFHTHFSATSTYRALRKAGVEAALCPVPRALSADCGTCVCYRAQDECRKLLHADFDRVVAVEEDGAYRQAVLNDAP